MKTRWIRTWRTQQTGSAHGCQRHNGCSIHNTPNCRACHYARFEGTGIRRRFSSVLYGGRRPTQKEQGSGGTGGRAQDVLRWNDTGEKKSCICRIRKERRKRRGLRPGFLLSVGGRSRNGRNEVSCEIKKCALAHSRENNHLPLRRCASGIVWKRSFLYCPPGTFPV